MAITRAVSFSHIIAPTGAGLSVDACLLSVRNTSSDKMLYLRRFAPIMIFTGTNAATASVFALQRQTATPTGGTVLTPTLHNSASAALDAEIRFSQTGLGGVTPGANHRFKKFGLPSQNVGTPIPPEFGVLDENIFSGGSSLHIGFGPGECLLVIADSAIVAGSRGILDFTLYQE